MREWHDQDELSKAGWRKTLCQQRADGAVVLIPHRDAVVVETLDARPITNRRSVAREVDADQQNPVAYLNAMPATGNKMQPLAHSRYNGQCNNQRPCNQLVRGPEHRVTVGGLEGTIIITTQQ